MSVACTRSLVSSGSTRAELGGALCLNILPLFYFANKGELARTSPQLSFLRSILPFPSGKALHASSR